MRSIGLISNPDSRRNRRAMPAIRRLLRSRANVTHREARTPDDIGSCLRRLAANPPDILAINGGDGTVHAVLTQLFNHDLFEPLPLLALIPGGNTNMTARDSGLRGGVTGALRRLCRWAASERRAPEIVQRPVVRVRRSPAAEALYGMFFGAGAIVRGIQYCHGHVYKLGIHDELAPGLATLRLLVAIARRDPTLAAPLPVGVAMEDGGTVTEGDCLLLLISTLERLFLGIRPYWGNEQGMLHYTWVRHSPAHPLRAFPSLLRGTPNRFGTPGNGYESKNLTGIKLLMNGLFTLDGELYEASRKDGPVTISHTEPVSFLRL